MTPAISVLLAVRDGRKTLARSLASLKAQTWQDWECIVIDDGSIDESGEVARSSGDDRIRVFQQDRAGLTAALVHGLSLARGRLIARLDADDQAMPERFSRQLGLLDADSGVVALGTGVESVSPEGVVISTTSYPQTHQGLAESLDRLVNPIPHASLMVRREALETVGGYRTRFVKAQDYDLLLRLCEVGRLASLPEPLVRLGVDSDSMTTRIADGSQFEYGVLGYVSAVIRRSGNPDPLNGPEADGFIADFRSWYRRSPYPRIFASRLSRRAARMSFASGNPFQGGAALVRACVADPGWPIRFAGVGGDIGQYARDWVKARPDGAH